MSDYDESTVVKEDVISEIREEMISYKATEEENLNISKVIADCQDALQQKVLQKLIGRSGKKKQIFRKLAMFSKEIDYVMTDMEMLKYQNATSIPAQAIRQFTEKYQKLTEDMENLVLNRSMLSIDERKQDLIYDQKKMLDKVNEIIKNNNVSKATLRTGNWKIESQILNSLLQQTRIQGQVIDKKDNMRQKRIQELQKKIIASKHNLNLIMREHSEKQADMENYD